MLGRRRRRFARGEPVPLLLCIDVEPDDREIAAGAAATWDGLAGLIAREPPTRARLEAATRGPVSLNWFLRADPQIAATCGDHRHLLRHWAPLWASLAARGDELGIHAHAWREDADGRPVVDHGDPAWVEHCVAISLDAYREELGAIPPSYRGGDRFTSEAVVEQIDAAGVAVDCTVEPGMPATDRLDPGERATGTIPDYTGAPLAPYRPAAGDFLRSVGDGSARRLTVVPLTPGASGTLAAWIEPDEFAEGLRARLARGAPTHLAFAIRSDLAQWDNAWERMLANLEAAIRALGSGGGRFVRASSLAVPPEPVASG